MNKKFGMGLLPSSYDSRDYRISKIALVAMEHEDEYEVEWMPPVYNQGLIGSCVSFALKTLREVQQYRDNGEYMPLSNGFIYANRLPEHHQGEGMHTREALSQLLKDGVCREFMFNLNTFYSKMKGMLTPEMYQNAERHRIEAYARAYTRNEVLSAIKELGGVVVAIPIVEDFRNADKILDKASGEIQGYHLVMAYGWKYIDGQLYLKIRNSWGSSWGNNGNILMPFDYADGIAFWAVTDKLDEEIENKDYFIKGKLGDNKLINTKTGEIIEMDTDIQIVNNRVMLPIRAISETLGRTIHWDSRLKEFYIPIKE